MLLDVTNGQLDLEAANLAAELAKPLDSIDRNYPGFGDFALSGRRAVEPGSPGRSLLYHALASPEVATDRSGRPLGDFPTPAEIEVVENFVYGARPVTLQALRDRAGGKPLAIAVFALGYRNAAASVHGRHADLCFSRTGIARLGTDKPHYDGRTRSFEAYDPARPNAFRVVPQRFAAYVAIRSRGDRDLIGPQDFLEGDAERDFWIPLHKLFDGPECIAGRDLVVSLSSHLRNEKLRRFHRFLEMNGYRNEWTGGDLDQYPFTIKDARIASLSTRSEYGPGMLEPQPHPFATPASYKNKPLGFTVDGDFTSQDQVLYFTSLQILGGPPDTAPSYLSGAAQQTDRSAPEYVNLRHPIGADGAIRDLNRDPHLAQLLRQGGYQALHYVDFSGDGWIEAQCPAIDADVPQRVSAFCMVSPPDFFPKINQRDMMAWWRKAAPAPLREGLWAIPPYALSQTRIAPDITLPAGFSINDTGVAAIVSHPTGEAGPIQRSNGLQPAYGSGLPDCSPGVFDPGWDASQGVHFTDPDEPLQKFLQGYGLGSPFVEDVKLCAALGSYWPAVAPDSTRTFAPVKRAPGFDYPWPTIAPLTDQETGIEPIAEGVVAPWDGVRGPGLERVAGREMAVYPDIDRVDYIDTADRMTGLYLSRIGPAEYQARILAMAAVYWSLGIRPPEFIARHSEKDKDKAVAEILLAKSQWAVLSFRAVDNTDRELSAAERTTGNRLDGPRRFRFHLFRPGAQTADPGDLGKVRVELREQVVAYCDTRTVLLRRGDGPWQCDLSIPTS